MHASTANKLFVEALVENLDEVELDIGDTWPWYRELILECYERLSDAGNQSTINEEIDNLLDLLISSPAADRIRKFLRYAQRTSDTIDSGLRTGRRRVDAVSDQSDLVPAMEALATRLIPQQCSGFVRVPVYFATDRAPSAKGYFGPERGELAFGVAWVSIPDRHRIGEIERPRWWKFEFSDAPNHFVTVMQADTLLQNAFEQQVRDSLKDSEEKSILLFIHGYNVTFVQALRRTAQLAYDLSYSGVPILYSWPSQGRTMGYLIDETNITRTEPHLQKVLEIVRSKVGARDVNVVAHSMGNRALVQYLASNRVRSTECSARLRHIVLAAPDIDAEVFRNQVMKMVPNRESRLTLYASSRDRALQLSRRVHGYPRAGDSGDDLVVYPDIFDTIDATAVSTSLLGHSYYGDDRSIVSDIYALIRDGSLPPRFGMSPGHRNKLTYWVFRP